MALRWRLDRSSGRLTLAAFLSLTAFAASINLFFAALVRIGAEYGVRPELLASAASVYFSAFVVVSILGGYFADRAGTRKVLMAGCIALAAGGLALGFSDGPTALIPAVVTMGLGGGILEGMASALLVQLYPNKERQAINLSQAAYCCGAIVGPLLMGILLPRGVDWRAFFLVVAILAAVNLALYGVSRYEASGQGQGFSPSEAVSVLRTWSVVQLCLVVFLYVLAEAAVVAFLNIYLFEFRAAPEASAIQSIAYFWGAMLLGRLLCGALPGRWSDRWLIFITMALGAVAAASSVLAGDWRYALASLLAAAFFMGGAWPTTVALTGARHRSHASTVVGVTVALGALGCVAAPPIMGSLFQYCDPGLVMALPAFPLVLGGLLALPVPGQTGARA
jgi:FHS family glucose/mannose:H+ symporter-like MFS transporter